MWINFIKKLNQEMKEKQKEVNDLKFKNDKLINEKLIIEEKNLYLFNRLKESVEENDDLIEKIKRYEYMLSLQNQNTKSEQFNLLNNGINLDYLCLNDGNNLEEKNNEGKNKEEENYTINMKVNVKKNHHNYGMNRQIQPQSVSNEITKKKDILQISELMTQKPILSKV